MGYSTRPEMISENAEILSRIRDAITKGESLRLRVRDQATISTEQYRLRRVLAACDNHPSAYGGEFARLGQQVTLKVDAENGYIVASPKAGVLLLDEFRASERDALEFLREAKGSLTMLEFFPSPEFNIDEFVRRAFDLGWTVHPSTATKNSEGKIEVAAERNDETPSESSGFGALFGG